MNNLVKRILAGVIGIQLIIGAVYFGGVYFLIFSIAVASLGIWEFCTMFEKRGFLPLKVLGIILSVVLISLVYSGWKYFELSAIILIPLIATPEIFRQQRDPLNAAILISGIIYVTFPMFLLNELIGTGFNSVVICIFILIWACDTAAYFAGRAFGKHKLSNISPNKTWEGSVAGLVFTLIVSYAIYYFSNTLDLTDAIVLGFIIGIFSQIGDLLESFIKRYCEVKDSSNIIPGHGGVLDRFDSLLFVTPVIFIYFAYIK